MVIPKKTLNKKNKKLVESNGALSSLFFSIFFLFPSFFFSAHWLYHPPLSMEPEPGALPRGVMLLCTALAAACVLLAAVSRRRLLGWARARDDDDDGGGDGAEADGAEADDGAQPRPRVTVAYLPSCCSVADVDAGNANTRGGEMTRGRRRATGCGVETLRLMMTNFCGKVRRLMTNLAGGRICRLMAHFGGALRVTMAMVHRRPGSSLRMSIDPGRETRRTATTQCTVARHTVTHRRRRKSRALATAAGLALACACPAAAAGLAPGATRAGTDHALGARTAVGGVWAPADGRWCRHEDAPQAPAG
jgi:hypothetical protein